MTTPPPARRRLLDTLLNARRLELGMRWSDVATAGGVSAEAIRAMRHDDAGVRDLTAAGTERALLLRPGSIRAFMDGDADDLPVAAGAPQHRDDVAAWVAAQMTARGRTAAEVLEFAGRMGWRGRGAPAADDMSVRQWRLIAAELGMALDDALRAFTAAGGDAAGGDSGGPRRGRPATAAG